MVRGAGGVCSFVWDNIILERPGFCMMGRDIKKRLFLVASKMQKSRCASVCQSFLALRWADPKLR